MKALFILLAACSLLRAEVSLDPIYADHMVLQQGKPIIVAGSTSRVDRDITVIFNGKRAKAFIHKNRWQAELPPMQASARPRDLTVEQGADRVKITDVLVGEVWIAAGQSNMLFRVDETDNAKEILAAANNPLLRVRHSEPRPYMGKEPFPESELKRLEEGRMFEGQWAVSNPKSITRASAVGYLFASRLQKALGVPVGIIDAALGGSEMICWVPEQKLRQEYGEVLDSTWRQSPFITPWHKECVEGNLGEQHLANAHPFQPGYLFRTGVAPWLKMNVAGVIWYQGEADAEIPDAAQSEKLLTELIKGWRDVSASPKENLPFLMVQLPRINDSSELRAFWPEFRELQAKVANSLPGVACICTIDLGTTNANVHPPRKDQVAERLANRALADVYRKNVPSRGPEFQKARVDEEDVYLTFSHADGLRSSDGKPVRGFELAGRDGQFSPATAVVKGKTVKLTADFVDEPVEVRYNWAVYAEPNLVNRHNLPAMPFRAKLK